MRKIFTEEELLSMIEGRDRIPLREVGEWVGMSDTQRSRAVNAGVIRTTGRAGLGGGYVIDQDEARRLIIAAVRAATVGMAIVTVLRALGAGAR